MGSLTNLTKPQRPLITISPICYHKEVWLFFEEQVQEPYLLKAGNPFFIFF